LQYFTYLESENIPAIYWLNRIRAFIGAPEYMPNKKGSVASDVAPKLSRNTLTFIDAWLGLLTHSDWRALHIELLSSSPEYVVSDAADEFCLSLF
jgi:hypothetical protein